MAALAAGCIHVDGDPPPADCTSLGLAGAAVAPEATRGPSSWKKADPPRPAARPSGLTSSSAPRHRKDIDIDIEVGPCG
ncbi:MULTISPECIES: hypothetical protein [unclassified Streptomyces]|uniref:hypothetical protein n=1 Tax=unclassified Streptomyces TaxID=2593676 RepID=UPI0003746373|nr:MULTISPECIES: hypothetical protein [unclassified Streptomyces]MYX33447.1 hypothetical protein [Streptomyces sp. SID8377]